MGSMMRVLVPVCLLLASIVAITGTEGDVSCNTVVANLYPCAEYVAEGGSIPGSCCNGIRMLNRQAKRASDRQDVCRCIKSALGGVSYSSKNLKNAASLPAKCRVHLTYKIDPSTDCNSIK